MEQDQVDKDHVRFQQDAVAWIWFLDVKTKSLFF